MKTTHVSLLATAAFMTVTFACTAVPDDDQTKDPTTHTSTTTNNESGNNSNGATNNSSTTTTSNSASNNNAEKPVWNNSCADEIEEILQVNEDPYNGGVETETDENGVHTTVLDGSAGGYSAASGNSATYFSFETGEKVAIDDYTAFESVQWQVAFKRVVIRANSEDSGPGDVEVALVEGVSFDALTAPPQNALFSSDDFVVGENCEVMVDQMNNPRTIFDGWYHYDQAGEGGKHVIVEADHMYLIKWGDDHRVKLQLLDYYEGSTSGIFTFKWKEL